MSMNNDLEQFSEERLMELIHESSKPEIEALARIALAAKQAKPVGYLFVSPGSGIAYSISNVDFEGAKLVGPIYSTPQPAHTEQSEMLNKARSLSESIGELRKQIDSSGGYDFVALRSEQVNSPVIPDGWRLVPIEPTQEMVDAHISGMQSAGFSRAYLYMLAAAPKPESE